MRRKTHPPSARRLARMAGRRTPGTSRHRRPRPNPHTPFTTRALSIPTDAGPPPNGSPLSGKMMNQDVSVGGKAPSNAPLAQYRQSAGTRVKSHAIGIDHTPPQNVSDRTSGVPSGLVGRIG